METPKLQRGQALIIVGARRTGRAELARRIAAEWGTYAEASARQLLYDSELDRVVAVRVKTAIFDGLPKGLATANRVKALIASDTAPSFIFCTGAEPKLDAADRRFVVIHAPTP